MIFRRHLNHCPHWSEGRRYWRCYCPIWFDARIGGLRVHKSMHLRDWEQAKALAQKWVEEGEATTKADICGATRKKVEPMSLERAWAQFLAQAEARKLRPATIYKYDLLRRQMQAFAQRQGLRLLREFDLDVLETFQAEWREG